jgi:uncharacterized protein YqgV (UPF0045/DUF77 family)
VTSRRLRAEFTVEPFVAGSPGAHVLAAIEAARSFAVDVEVGPFGTAVCGDASLVADVVAAVVDTAMAAGATRVALQVEPA